MRTRRMEEKTKQKNESKVAGGQIESDLRMLNHKPMMGKAENCIVQDAVGTDTCGYFNLIK